MPPDAAALLKVVTAPAAESATMISPAVDESLRITCAGVASVVAAPVMVEIGATFNGLVPVATEAAL